MEQKYTNDISTQIILFVLKANNIRKVVASPGTTNIALVASMQQDPFFEMYSSVDERSAAYMACGLAEESGEAVILSCTGATASRNYMPGLTEAYYRKLPILAITGSHGDYLAGQLYAQVLDRSVTPRDVVKFSVSIPTIKDANDEWINTVNINTAVLELFRHGGGPVHINLELSHSGKFEVEKLSSFRIIRRIFSHTNYPDLPHGRIAIFLGSHRLFSQKENEVIDEFCAQNDAVVFCDHTSGYKGRYAINFALVATQANYDSPLCKVDLLIHLGNISGEYYSLGRVRGKQTWRISEDGEIKDPFRNLTYIFEMNNTDFFSHYIPKEKVCKDDYLKACKKEYELMLEQLPEVGFTNIWIAQQLHDKLPCNSTLHFSIFNSLRSWNFFEVPLTIRTNCNVGGFGIDGSMSTLIGASLVHPDKLYFCIIGDLAFFYDMNSLGNRHIGKNLRIMLVNNGRGTEFRNYDHPGAAFGDDADAYIAAAGHFGNKSQELVKHYVTDLGFKYLSASNKEDFATVYAEFISENKECSMLFEVFTNSISESAAIESVRNIVPANFVDKLKNSVKRILKAVSGN